MKVKMHTPLNRLSFWFLFPMLAVGCYLVYRDAANDLLRIVGIATIFLLILFGAFISIFKFCEFDYAIFTDKGIELHSPFKKKAFFKYDEVIACPALYTSLFENKKYITFTPKCHNAVVDHIDTSKYGNVITLNKMQVIYVPMTDKLVEFLKKAPDLKIYVRD